MKYVATFVILAALAGCNTLRGAGQDIETGGEVVGGAVEGVGEGVQAGVEGVSESLSQ